jgi:hypothetical protein
MCVLSRFLLLRNLAERSSHLRSPGRRSRNTQSCFDLPSFSFRRNPASQPRNLGQKEFNSGLVAPTIFLTKPIVVSGGGLFP